MSAAEDALFAEVASILSGVDVDDGPVAVSFGEWGPYAARVAELYRGLLTAPESRLPGGVNAWLAGPDAPEDVDALTEGDPRADRLADVAVLEEAAAGGPLTEDQVDGCLRALNDFRQLLVRCCPAGIGEGTGEAALFDVSSALLAVLFGEI